MLMSALSLAIGVSKRLCVFKILDYFLKPRDVASRLEGLLHPSFEKAKRCASSFAHGLTYLPFLFRPQTCEHLQKFVLDYFTWPKDRSEAAIHETRLELGM
jgi:hypothetical protein